MSSLNEVMKIRQRHPSQGFFLNFSWPYLSFRMCHTSDSTLKSNEAQSRGLKGKV